MKKHPEQIYTVVVNVSLRSVRTIIFSDNGEKVYEDWLPVRTSVNGYSVEQDPNEWWVLLKELLKKIFSYPEYASHIQFLTVTSSALCMVMMDKKGQVLGKSIMVSDKRATQEAADIKETFASFFTTHPAVKAEPSYMIPKILWVKRHDLKLFKKIAYILSANDFFIFRLTGKVVTDELNAEKFYFDTKKKRYPANMLEYIGVDRKLLPNVVVPGTLVGGIDKSLQEELGAKQSIRIIVSTYDAIAAFIGSNTHVEGELTTVCGTCSSYRMFISHAPQQKNNLLLQHLSSENTYIVGASNNLEGGVLEWAKECFYGDSYLKDDDFLYSLMQTEAQESELGANGIIFLPYLLGERMPFSDPNVRGTFFGIERFHTRKDIIRSVFEAVAFQAKLMLEEFEKNEFTIGSVTMSGGVAKMSFAAQLRSDILGLPVQVLSEIETTAVGAFILSLLGRKKIKHIHEMKHVVHVKSKYLPNMHNHNCYASLFMLYKQLYTEHKDLFKRRKDILEGISHYRKKVLENL